MVAVSSDDIYTILAECIKQAIKATQARGDAWKLALSATLTTAAFMAKLLCDVEGLPPTEVLRKLGFPEELLTDEAADKIVNETPFNNKFEPVQSSDDALIDIIETVRVCLEMALKGPPEELKQLERAAFNEDAIAGTKTGAIITAGFVAQSMAHSTEIPVELVLAKMGVPEDSWPQVRELGKIYHIMQLRRQVEEDNKGETGDNQSLH